jgi:hypothetical protein
VPVMMDTCKKLLEEKVDALEVCVLGDLDVVQAHLACPATPAHMASRAALIGPERPGKEVDPPSPRAMRAFPLCRGRRDAHNCRIQERNRASRGIDLDRGDDGLVDHGRRDRWR